MRNSITLSLGFAKLLILVTALSSNLGHTDEKSITWTKLNQTVSMEFGSITLNLNDIDYKGNYKEVVEASFKTPKSVIERDNLIEVTNELYDYFDNQHRILMPSETEVCHKPLMLYSKNGSTIIFASVLLVKRTTILGTSDIIDLALSYSKDSGKSYKTVYFTNANRTLLPTLTL